MQIIQLYSVKVLEDLQNIIDSVYTIANDDWLYVNLNQTKIVVFRSRGNVKAEERWF